MISFFIEPKEIIQGLATELNLFIQNGHDDAVTQLAFNIDIPNDICLIRGSTKVNVPFIACGQMIKLPLFLRASKPNPQNIRIEGVSYQKPDGKVAHVPAIPLLISVIANEQHPLPDRIVLEISLFPSELFAKEWSVLRGVVRNRGARSAVGLVLGMEKPWLFDPCYLEPINQKGQANFELHVTPPQFGKVVPGMIVICSPSGAILYKGRLNINVEERKARTKANGSENMIFRNSQVEITYGNRVQTDHSGDEVNIRRTYSGQQKESAIKCRICQHVNEPEAKYCIKCRASLEG